MADTVPCSRTGVSDGHNVVADIYCTHKHMCVLCSSLPPLVNAILVKWPWTTSMPVSLCYNLTRYTAVSYNHSRSFGSL